MTHTKIAAVKYVNDKLSTSLALSLWLVSCIWFKKMRRKGVYNSIQIVQIYRFLIRKCFNLAFTWLTCFNQGSTLSAFTLLAYFNQGSANYG